MPAISGEFKSSIFCQPLYLAAYTIYIMPPGTTIDDFRSSTLPILGAIASYPITRNGNVYSATLPTQPTTAGYVVASNQGTLYYRLTNLNGKTFVRDIFR